MRAASPADFEIIDFIAAGATPQAVAHLRPSPEAQQRVAELIGREKAARLSPEEKAELPRAGAITRRTSAARASGENHAV